MENISRKLNFGFVVALLVILAIGAVGAYQANKLAEDNRSLARSHEVLTALDRLLYTLTSAESSNRGFLSTGAHEFQDRYASFEPQVTEQLDRVRALVAENAAQRQNAAQLTARVTRKVELMRHVLELRQAQRTEEAQLVMRTGGREAMEAVRQQVQVMRSQEELVIAQSSQDVANGLRITLLALGLGTLVGLVLGAYSRTIILRDLARRTQVERELAESNQNLSAGLRQLHARTEEMTLLHEVTDLLQSSRDLQEAAGVVSAFVPRLFPEASKGALFLMNNSRDLLEASATWGEDVKPNPFEPEECWSLRLGHLYQSAAGGSQPHCAHLGAGVPFSLCLPLVAHNEMVGALVLESTGRPFLAAEQQAGAATTAAEAIALAFANLRLQERLRMQSIRDPLTGLFNRRYLEETLQRELRRASRSERPLALAILDLDHFKRFNDSYGHQAGDQLLCEVGAILRRRSRSSDVAARLGGEEFVLLLLDATVEQALARVQSVCDELRGLNLQYMGQPLGTATASVGLAAAQPDQTAEELLRAADAALYRAKNEGRDRIAIAASTPLPDAAKD